jgi:adenylosuccinate lyase
MTTKFKDVILEIIKQRTIIDENKPLTYYLKMENRVNKLSEEDCEKLVMNILEDIAPERKTAMSGLGTAVSASGSTLGLSVGGWSAPIAYAIYRAVRGKFDECSKACGTYAINTPKRQICMAKCNLMKNQEIYDSLVKHKAPKYRIDQAKEKLIISKKKYEEYAQYAKLTGRNPNPNVKPGEKNRFRIPG